MDDWDFHCKIVGVKGNVSLEEIKKAYHESAKILHPDRHQNSSLAKMKFQELKESYEYLLTNLSKKASNTTFSGSSANPNQNKTQKQSTYGSEAKNIRSYTMEEFIPLIFLEYREKRKAPPSIGNVSIEIIEKVVKKSWVKYPFGGILKKVILKPFKCGMFADSQLRALMEKHKQEYINFMDKQESNKKLELLYFAIFDYGAYRKFVFENWIPEYDPTKYV